MKKIRVIFLIILIFLTNIKTAFGEVETTENKAFMKPEEVREYMKYMDEPEEVQRAREAIFNGENEIVEQIAVSEYKDYFVDKKYSPNQKFRDATFYSNGMYRIWLNRDISFVYDKGELIYIIKKYYLNRRYDSDLEFYYQKDGTLKYIIFEVKKMTLYLFNEKKEYLCKRYNYKFYNKEEKVILKTRPYLPYR